MKPKGDTALPIRVAKVPEMTTLRLGRTHSNWDSQSSLGGKKNAARALESSLAVS